MLTDGDTAPEFTAPLAHGDDEISSLTLSDRLDDGPLVLAFFPGAFTTTCTHEMNEFQHRLSTFEDAGVSVYGLSVDSPFSLNAFRDRLGLEFGIISDANREIVEQYDVSMDWVEYGLNDFAKRAVFVLNGDGEITYAWIADGKTMEPEYDDIEAAAKAATV